MTLIRKRSGNRDIGESKNRKNKSLPRIVTDDRGPGCTPRTYSRTRQRTVGRSPRLRSGKKPESFVTAHPYTIQAFMMTWFQEALWGASVTVESELTRLRGGDVEAVAAVMERYQHRLYRYLLRLLREPATAEDLFQQTWVKVMERIRSVDPSHNFEGWLFAMARNLAIDYLRRYRPESLDEPLPSGDSRAELIPGAGPGALDQMLARE